MLCAPWMESMENSLAAKNLFVCWLLIVVYEFAFRIICGRRVKVELSTGKSRHDKPGGGRGFRGPPGPPGRFRDSPPRRMESRYPYGGGGGGRDRRGNGYDDGRYPRHRYSR